MGARFSDCTVKLDYATQKEIDAFHAHPLHYEKQFLVAPGTYNLKAWPSAPVPKAFGKMEAAAHHRTVRRRSLLALERSGAQQGSASGC